MNTWTTRCGQSNGCIDIIERTQDVSGTPVTLIELRDSEGGMILATRQEWTQLCAAIKAGHLDHIGHQP